MCKLFPPPLFPTLDPLPQTFNQPPTLSISQQIMPHISLQFSLPSSIQIPIMLQKVKIKPPINVPCPQINKVWLDSFPYCVY